MLAFSHIPKTGGTTLIQILRRTYGVRHVDAIDRHAVHSAENVYRARDLRWDLRIHPRLESIAGHELKPHVDYGDLERELAWITFVREPMARSFSQYVQDVQLGYLPASTTYREWTRIAHLGGQNRNAQVRQLCGRESFEAAREVIERKLRFVGVLERFDESLRLLRVRMDRPELPESAGSAKNERRSSGLREKERERDPDFEECLREQNPEDARLYEYVTTTCWRAQQERASRESIPAARAADPDALRPKLRTFANRLYRNAIYKPLVRVDRAFFAGG
jgi:hypothetical protein